MAQHTTPTYNAAVNAYVLAQQDARALLAQLTLKLDRHQECTSPDDIHWGHVGDLTAIVAALETLVRP